MVLIASYTLAKHYLLQTSWQNVEEVAANVRPGLHAAANFFSSCGSSRLAVRYWNKGTSIGSVPCALNIPAENYIPIFGRKGTVMLNNADNCLRWSKAKYRSIYNCFNFEYTGLRQVNEKLLNTSKWVFGFVTVLKCMWVCFKK